MIVSRLAGGLGNQFFQYALGQRLALERGVPLKLDLGWYESPLQRLYRLDRFRIAAVQARPAEIERVFHLGKKDLVSILVHRWERLLPYYRRRVIYEKGPGFDTWLLKAPSSVYLAGNWQSPHYFTGIEPALCQEFQLVEPIKEETALLLAEELGRGHSISLHIRRGDYVNEPKTAAHHGTCPTAYYREAVEYLVCREAGLRVYVFSDDIRWAKQNLELNLPTEFVSGRYGLPDYQELELMRRCKHHVIANSTFSWWAAWLADEPGKVVVAPCSWFSKIKDQDLIPAGWIRL